jgi:DNA polymerase type B, organellar and viral
MNKTHKPDPMPIPVAVRVYPEPPKDARARGQAKAVRPDPMIVFDTETTTDPTQRLLFGCYRFLDNGVCTEEGLFYAPDLSSDQLKILRQYANRRLAGSEDRGPIKLIPLNDFLDRLFKAAYKGRSLVVGFNLPFDLSRLAFNVTPARREFGGGFSLGLWTYTDKSGVVRLDPNRPRITIKHIDSKRSLISFTGRRSPDEVDLIPEGSVDGKPRRGYKFRGHFLDLKTLAFALTDRSHTLRSACEAFGVERGKIEAETHGEITDEYIDYNRRDVEATAELALALLAEFDRHPIALAETKAFSAASIGKAYLRSMVITPILERQSNLLPYVGYAQTAYFGGRTSAHIRKTPVPVVYTDFLSMYPTVNSLMGLWSYVIAREIKVIDHCQAEIIRFLKGITVDQLFDPRTWSKLRAFVKIIPNGDILPVRGSFNSASNDWQVAINHVYASTEDDGLWYSLPDVVVSVLLTGSIPDIVDAFRIEPSKQVLPNLRPTKFRGEIGIDPRRQDFFKVVIEERKRLRFRKDLTKDEREWLDKGLKVLANSTSYGIYGQMDRKESNERKTVKCHGLDPDPYECRVQNPDVPGESAALCWPL